MSVERGIKHIDTHTFKGKSRRWGVPHDNSHYFKDSRFQNTKFFAIPFRASSNMELLSQVENDSRFLGMYLMFNPNEESQLSTSADKLSRVIKVMNKDLVVGAKTHPALFRIPMNDRRYLPYYNELQRRGLPVLIHAAGSGQDFNSAEMTREILEKFPDLKIILAHFGGLNPKYMEQSVVLTEKFPNLYLNTTTMDQIGRPRRTDNRTYERSINTDVSEAEVEAMKRDALNLFMAMALKRPRQILFGSDLGYNPPEEYSLWPVTEVDHSTAQIIFLENPQVLFGKKMKRSVPREAA